MIFFSIGIFLVGFFFLFTGKATPYIGAVIALIGLGILFAQNWIIGLIILVISLCFLVFQGSDTKKIKRILLAYKDVKSRFPNKSEDELCRLVIATRLYNTRFSNRPVV